jgi:hypothetical protein
MPSRGPGGSRTTAPLAAKSGAPGKNRTSLWCAPGIRGRSVDTNGGHWTISAARGPTARTVLAEQLHAALGARRARCRHLRLDDEPVEACQVPTTDDGYYSGHIAYAWEHRGVVYHITIHGHANEPRVALMMAAFFKRVTSRSRLDSRPIPPRGYGQNLWPPASQPTDQAMEPSRCT